MPSELMQKTVHKGFLYNSHLPCVTPVSSQTADASSQLPQLPSQDPPPLLNVSFMRATSLVLVEISMDSRGQSIPTKFFPTFLPPDP